MQYCLKILSALSRVSSSSRQVKSFYLLRCKQLGFTLPELSLIEEGMVFDVLLKSDNDENGDYCEVARQGDMDNW